MEHLDVLIVGAGLSGIDAAFHLQQKCPGRTYAIFEGREALGGTWDLFRYPGVRSDSDMFTLGFAFRPWTEAKAIADGPAILKYLNEAADDYGIRRHIRYSHAVKIRVVGFGDVAMDDRLRQGRVGRIQPGSPATSCSCARATTTTPRATAPRSPARTRSRAVSSIRSTGRRISTTPASASW